MPGYVEIDRRLPDDLRAQTGSGADVQSKQQSPAYYDISMLQAPVWEGRYIGTYFWLGGLSGGAYLVARMSEIFGGEEFRDCSRAGTTVSMLADLPCAPLLIADLGDWSRFHHMLRVWKPQSPMNFGSWVVTGFSAACAGAVLRDWIHAAEGKPRSLPSKVADRTLAVITDVTGIPLALLMISYTGVLLSGTATPAWSRNKWLAPLFAASAIGNGASAVSLAMQFMKKVHPRRQGEIESALDKLESAAHVAELVLRQQYLKSLGQLNEPLTRGKQSGYLLANTACTIGSELLRYAPLTGRAKKWAKIGASALGVLGGLALKYGILEAGAPSANDPAAARYAGSRKRRLEDGSEPAKYPFPAPKAQPLRFAGADST
ncbi:MAG TPA: NrfD/PsrC family molybdoenzyme membrane anchor subunit [Rhodopila sp.]